MKSLYMMGNTTAVARALSRQKPEKLPIPEVAMKRMGHKVEGVPEKERNFNFGGNGHLHTC